MPKVEPEFVEECESGRRVVPLSDLDRANAEIERITKQRDGLVLDLWAFADRRILAPVLKDALAKRGLAWSGDTVTEIDRG